MNISEVKAQIVQCCQRLWARGYVANHDGNISCKMEDGKFLATPTSFSKKDVTEEDLLIIDGEGNVLEGKHKVFSEFNQHLVIYKARPDVRAIVHGHPYGASAFGASQKTIGTPAVAEAIVSIGKSIETLKSFTPDELARVLKDSDGFVAAGNGAWTVGQGVMQTYLRLEFLEEVAQVHLLAESLGGVKPLSADLVAEQFKKRSPAQVQTKVDSVSEVSRIKELVQQELERILSQRR